MPPRHSRHRLLAGVGLLSLLTALLLPLEGLLPARAPSTEPTPVLMLGMLGALLSCGWFLLGCALGSLLRTSPRAPPASASPAPSALSRMSTEQLYRELERMNRETLLYESGLTRCAPYADGHERRENDFPAA